MLTSNWARSAGWGVLACLTAAACSGGVASTSWKRNGDGVDRDVVDSLQGSEHCGQDATACILHADGERVEAWPRTRTVLGCD